MFEISKVSYVNALDIIMYACVQEDERGRMVEFVFVLVPFESMRPTEMY